VAGGFNLGKYKRIIKLLSISGFSQVSRAVEVSQVYEWG